MSGVGSFIRLDDRLAEGLAEIESQQFVARCEDQILARDERDRSLHVGNSKRVTDSEQGLFAARLVGEDHLAIVVFGEETGELGEQG